MQGLWLCIMSPIVAIFVFSVALAAEPPPVAEASVKSSPSALVAFLRPAREMRGPGAVSVPRAERRRVMHATVMGAGPTVRAELSARLGSRHRLVVAADAEVVVRQGPVALAAPQGSLGLVTALGSARP